MTMTTGDNGGGSPLAGTAGSMCAISPSDLVGTIGNLITRIEKMEQILSQLLGANLAANSLSDISQQVGWVYGIEYAGVPGWTQTPAGTLIPPAGFSLSGSGLFKMYNACTGEVSDYQGVVMDENGVLQFGFTKAGELCGDKVQKWDAAVAGLQVLDFGLFHYNRLGANINTVRGTSISLSAMVGGSVGTASEIVANITETGLYSVHAFAEWSTLTTTGARPGVGIETSQDASEDTIPFDNNSQSGTGGQTVGKSSTSRLAYISGSGWIRAYTQAQADWSTQRLMLHIVQLSA